MRLKKKELSENDDSTFTTLVTVSTVALTLLRIAYSSI